MAQQLTFDLPARESRERGDFFVSDANAYALARIEAFDAWPNLKLVLVGTEGAGKTHLAHVWTDIVHGRIIRPEDLAKLDVTSVAQPIVLDDADSVPEDQEELLFHLHNHMASRRVPFLLTARITPIAWKVVLPDLRSRMVATDVVKIEEPDDALLAAVLLKLFADRQLSVAPNVITWLIGHMDRSFAMAQQVVARLDAAALTEGRAITRSFAHNILKDQ